MQFSMIPKVLGHGLLGSLSLGVLLSTSAAQAVLVNKGTDYLSTTSVSQFTAELPGGGSITFPVIGLPIGTPTLTPPNGGDQGKADTVINRLNDVDLGGILPAPTDVKIVGLSLISAAPVGIPGFVGLYDIFIGLDPGKVSDGLINMTASSFVASFSISEKFAVAPAGSLVPSGTDYIKNLIAACGTATTYQCFANAAPTQLIASGDWVATPEPDFLTGPNLVDPLLPINFYLNREGITLRTPVGSNFPKIHGVVPTPGPLPVLGAGTAYACARRLRKRCRQAMKVS
jgi:hypothetical protein